MLKAGRLGKIRASILSKRESSDTTTSGSRYECQDEPTPSSSPPKDRRLSLFSHVAQDLNLEGDDLTKLRRIRATIDAAFDPMFTIDSTGCIRMANDAAMIQFGYKYDEFVGSNISMICGGGHAARHNGYIQRYLETGVKHIIGTQREVPARRKDGTEFPVSLGIREIIIEEDNSKERYFCAYTRDLSEQKRHEHEIQLKQDLIQGMIDSSFDPMFAINERGIIHVANQAAVAMFGWSHDELIGSNICMICGGGHADRHNGYIQRYLKTGEARIIGRRRQVTARRKDGSEFEVDLGITEVKVAGNNGERIFCGFTRDLTRQILDQQTMRQQEGCMRDSFFPATNKSNPGETSDHLPLAPSPNLTPPSSPASVLSCPARSPRSPRRERAVSLGKHPYTRKGSNEGLEATPTSNKTTGL